MKKIVSALVLSVGLAGVGCTSSTEEELTEASDDTLALDVEAFTTRVSCASTFFQRRECPVDTQGGRIVAARITQEMSNPPFLCRQDDSHGFGSQHVWVDRGCSAEFEVTIQPPSMQAERIHCASFGQYNLCESNLRDIRSIRILFQEPPFDRCVEGQTYGFYSDAIWVDQGCRALFEVRGYASGGTSRRVELFDRRGFAGSRYVVTRGITDLASVGFDDRTQSLIVRAGTWEACTNRGFSGWCRTFGPGRYDDLGPLRGQISSIRAR